MYCVGSDAWISADKGGKKSVGRRGLLKNQNRESKERNTKHTHLSFSSFFFLLTSLEIGPVKKVLSTLCILVESPGARVGHAWLKVLAINGMQAAVEIISSSSSSSSSSPPSSSPSSSPSSYSRVETGGGGGGGGGGAKSGIEIGKFGFEVDDVGRGGKARISGVSPGMRRATTRWIVFAF